MARCGEGFERPLRRPISIHQLANGTKLALLVNVVGSGTHWLAQCRVGGSIDLLGPLGNGFLIHPESHNLLLVAGGIGIAPLLLLAQQTLERGLPVTLLHGGSTAAQLYPTHLLPPKARLITTTEDGTSGKKGVITALLPDYIDWADQIFACGPTPMYRAIANGKQQLKAKPVQVSLELRMGCGHGVCYGCTLKAKSGLKQVCQDGPVFNLDDVLWEELAY